MRIAKWKEIQRIENEKEKTCVECQKKFFSPHFGQKYCGHQCSDRAMRSRAKERGYKPKKQPFKPRLKKCRFCGDDFWTTRETWNAVHCSPKCSRGSELLSRKRSYLKRVETIDGRKLENLKARQWNQKNTRFKRALAVWALAMTGERLVRAIELEEIRQRELQRRTANSAWNRLPKDHPRRIRLKISTAILTSLKKYGGRKCYGSIEYLGCSIEHLKNHLESQFKTGMSWENHGIKGWHIDHIRPCASFDLSSPEQQKQCFHYTNLQPLWWHENIQKSDRMDWKPDESTIDTTPEKD
ncbi:MAG: hypothetical protein KGL39_10105 [Patescibacteria group bacterium]|nr:hypothetical protein [Patescibacteria group bacterium]